MRSLNVCVLFIQAYEDFLNSRKKLPELHLDVTDILSNILALNDKNRYLHTA